MPRSRFSLTCVVLTSVLLFGAGQPPQDRQDPPPDKKDPQSAFEPRSGPGAGQKFLAQLVGTWDVTKTFFPRMGDPVRVPGECVQTMVHEGRFLKSEFVFGQGPSGT